MGGRGGARGGTYGGVYGGGNKGGCIGDGGGVGKGGGGDGGSSGYRVGGPHGRSLSDISMEVSPLAIASPSIITPEPTSVRKSIASELCLEPGRWAVLIFDMPHTSRSGMFGVCVVSFSDGVFSFWRVPPSRE